MDDAQNPPTELEISSELAYSHTPGSRVVWPGDDPDILLMDAFTIDGKKGFAWVTFGAELRHLRLIVQHESVACGWATHLPFKDLQIGTARVISLDAHSTANVATAIVHVQLPDLSQEVALLNIMLAASDVQDSADHAAVTLEGAVLNRAADSTVRSGGTRSGNVIGCAIRNQDSLRVSTWSTRHDRTSAIINYSEMPGFPSNSDAELLWAMTPIAHNRAAVAAVTTSDGTSTLRSWIIEYNDEGYTVTNGRTRDLPGAPTGVLVNTNTTGSHAEIIVSTPTASSMHPLVVATGMLADGFEIFQGFIHEAYIDRDTEVSSYAFTGRHKDGTENELFVVDTPYVSDTRMPALPLGVPHAVARLTHDGVFTATRSDSSLIFDYHSRIQGRWSRYAVHEDLPMVGAPPTDAIIEQAPYYEVICRAFSAEVPVPSAPIFLSIVGGGEVLLHIGSTSRWVSSDRPVPLSADRSGVLRLRYRAQAIDSVALKFDTVPPGAVDEAIATGVTHQPSTPYLRYLAGLETDPHPTNHTPLPRVHGDGSALRTIRDPVTDNLVFSGSDTDMAAIEASIKEMATAAVDSTYDTRFVLQCRPATAFAFQHFDSARAFNQQLNTSGVLALSDYLDSLFSFFASTSLAGLVLREVKLEAQGPNVTAELSLSLFGGSPLTTRVSISRKELSHLAQGILKLLWPGLPLLDTAVRWICAVFNWDEIRRTQQALMALMQKGLTDQATQLATLKEDFPALISHFLPGTASASLTELSVGECTLETGKPSGALAHRVRAEYAIGRASLQQVYSSNTTIPQDIQTDLRTISDVSRPLAEEQVPALRAAYESAKSLSSLNATRADDLLKPGLTAMDNLSPSISQAAPALFDLYEHGTAFANEALFKDWRDELPVSLRTLWHAVFGDMPLSAAGASALLAAFATNVAWKIQHGRASEPFPDGQALTEAYNLGVAHGANRIILAVVSGFASGVDNVEPHFAVGLGLIECGVYHLDWVLGYLANPIDDAALGDYVAYGLALIAGWIQTYCRLFRRALPPGIPDVVATVVGAFRTGVLIWAFKGSDTVSGADIVLFLSELIILLPDLASMISLTPDPRWPPISAAITFCCIATAGALTIIGHNIEPRPAPRPRRPFAIDQADALFRDNRRTGYHYKVSGVMNREVEVFDRSSSSFRLLGSLGHGGLDVRSAYGSWDSPAQLRMKTGEFNDTLSRPYRRVDSHTPPPPPPPPPRPRSTAQARRNAAVAVLQAAERQGRRRRW
ncbi:hypothetical protein [Stenotrophomonas sp. SORGH_AS_0321]|uniref:hypothetical protein n=1 Tax=Stenotrophomonas sp. SORGH_AS_0321 TaxID=3041787 RepID=UPI002861089C|nr:hypothetical protein [Stenotrophomonas sp. SORGH_AS_0321]MDR6093235.1 hypothetical protein [Stenotrophomonas sp. SORGH_AS_0321]